MNRKTVLILGANGRFGLATAQAFAAAGWQVLAQVRRTPDPAMPQQAIVLRQDIYDTDSLIAGTRRHTERVDAVVHAINPEYTNAAWQREVMNMARAGMTLAHRLDALFMLPGNVYNFGEHMPALLQEDTPQQATTIKGQIRCALEAEMQRQANEGLRSVVIRAGDYFGSGTGSWIDLIIAKSLTKGSLVYPAALDIPHAWAYLPDLGRSFVAVAEHQAELPAFSSLHFPGNTLTGKELLDAIENAARELGVVGTTPIKRKGFSRLFWLLLRLAGVFKPTFRSVGEMSYLWRTPHSLSGSDLARTIDEVPATPLHDSMRATLSALGLGAAKAA